MVRGEAASKRREAAEKKITSRELYQTVSTVYFILGILRTDLWSQGRKKPSLGANESGPSDMQDVCHMNLINLVALAPTSHLLWGTPHKLTPCLKRDEYCFVYNY